MKVNKKNKQKIYDEIRRQYGSVSRFARLLGVSRQNVYQAINPTDPTKYNEVLRDQIERSINA